MGWLFLFLTAFRKVGLWPMSDWRTCLNSYSSKKTKLSVCCCWLNLRSKEVGLVHLISLSVMKIWCSYERYTDGVYSESEANGLRWSFWAYNTSFTYFNVGQEQKTLLQLSGLPIWAMRGILSSLPSEQLRSSLQLLKFLLQGLPGRKWGLRPQIS